MTDYREIMRLRVLGLNHSQIADSLRVSRTTVIHTLQRATAQGLSWQVMESMSDKEIAVVLFPCGEGVPSYRIPDYAYVHRELMRPGTTQELLWMEYCDRCHEAEEIPYQLTAFKKHYWEYAAQAKATMHINRKPGEIMEVDWAGHTAEIVDCDTGEILVAYPQSRLRLPQRLPGGH